MAMPAPARDQRRATVENFICPGSVTWIIDPMFAPWTVAASTHGPPPPKLARLDEFEALQ